MAVQTQDIPQIKINGQSLDDFIVMEVMLKKELLKPNELRFSMRKKSLLRDNNDIGFAIADNLLGADVSMSVSTSRQDQSMGACGETMIFDGIIFGAQSQRSTIDNAAIIDVTAYSPDYLLVDNPHCYSFENRTLEDIINKAIEDYQGTMATRINPVMTQTIPYVVQYNETTYQFLSRLAQRYGEYFFYEDKKLVFGQIPESNAITLHPNIDVLGYRYVLNMDHTAFAHAHHNYLKYSNRQSKGEETTQDTSSKLNNITYKHSHERFQKVTLQNYHAAVSENAPLDNQTQKSAAVEGVGTRSQMSTCHLRTNRADIKMGSIVTIQEYADGESPSLISHDPMMVCGINYRYTLNGHFENEITTIPSGCLYAPYSNNDLYPFCESQRAKVIDNKDPEQLGRIRVQFLWQELQGGNLVSPWLRIAQPHGGNDKGFYFVPEIGEEVMVAFENGNGEKPYVVGTLYHGNQTPGRNWYSDPNSVKAIRTRNGHTIEIHDEGANGYIRIYDYQKENYILTFSTDQRLIRLQSTGNIELYANNDIILHAHNNINLTADNNMNVQVGNNRDSSIGQNDREVVGHDQEVAIGNNQTTSIKNDHTLQVDNDRTTNIGNNDFNTVAEKSVLAAKEMKFDAEEKYIVYAKESEQKTDESIKYDGGNIISLKASNVKIN